MSASSSHLYTVANTIPLRLPFHVEYRIEAQKFGDATYITFWIKRSDGVSKLLTCI